MSRKGPWEGYRRQARERRLGTRQVLKATDREEGIFIQLAFVYGLRYLFRDELSFFFHMIHCWRIETVKKSLHSENDKTLAFTLHRTPV